MLPGGAFKLQIRLAFQIPHFKLEPQTFACKLANYMTFLLYSKTFLDIKELKMDLLQTLIQGVNFLSTFLPIDKS